MKTTKRTKYAVDTKVPVINSRSEIERELTKYGATSFGFALLPERSSIFFEFGGRRVRFDLPSKPGMTDREHRSNWRALFLSIKARLVAVDVGIETFEEAFLAHVVLADGQSLYGAVKDGIEQQYVTGRVGPLLLEGPSR
jgi:hypothetical protein